MKYQNVELHNICEQLETPGEKGFGISRLPADVRANVNEGAQRNVTHGAGCEIRGVLPPDGQAKIELQVTDDNCVPPIATVYHGNFSSQAIHVAQAPATTTITLGPPANFDMLCEITEARNLPFDPRLVRVCLPAIHPPRILSIEGGLTYPTPEMTPSRTVLSYGSSITHGAHAIGPHNTYASQCAYQLGYDLINLGVGGSAQMDAAMADHIASRDDWDIATFEMGINVREWPVEKFEKAVNHFVTTIAKAHPDKYLFCIDLFTNDDDFRAEPLRAIGFRETVAQIVAQFDTGRVIHIDGRSLLKYPGGLQVDLVHPNDNGMIEMGANLAAVIEQTLDE